MSAIEGTLAQVLAGEADWVVVEGDCAEVLPSIPDKGVAHVITDPPYSEHVHGKARRGASLPDGGGGKWHGEKDAGACISRASDLGFAALVDGQREACAIEFARIVRRWVLAFSDQEGAVRGCLPTSRPGCSTSGSASG
jgi:hypothetical protein